MKLSNGFSLQTQYTYLFINKHCYPLVQHVTHSINQCIPLTLHVKFQDEITIRITCTACYGYLSQNEKQHMLQRKPVAALNQNDKKLLQANSPNSVIIAAHIRCRKFVLSNNNLCLTHTVTIDCAIADKTDHRSLL